jgi:hypothetical protein
VWEALSANTSAVPRRNSAARTTAIETLSVTIDSESIARMPTRSRFIVTTIALRLRRSAIAPASSPMTSHGSCWRDQAMATRKGSCVCEATSSGPAANEIPSLRFEIHEDASSQRKPVPRRLGATISARRLVTRRHVSGRDRSPPVV